MDEWTALVVACSIRLNYFKVKRCAICSLFTLQRANTGGDVCILDFWRSNDFSNCVQVRSLSKRKTLQNVRKSNLNYLTQFPTITLTYSIKNYVKFNKISTNILNEFSHLPFSLSKVTQSLKAKSSANEISPSTLQEKLWPPSTLEPINYRYCLLTELSRVLEGPILAEKKYPNLITK